MPNSQISEILHRFMDDPKTTKLRNNNNLLHVAVIVSRGKIIAEATNRVGYRSICNKTYYNTYITNLLSYTNKYMQSISTSSLKQIILINANNITNEGIINFIKYHYKINICHIEYCQNRTCNTYTETQFELILNNFYSLNVKYL